MTVQLQLPADAEARLRELAASAGQDVQAFVLAAVKEKLDESAVQDSRHWTRSHSEWTAALQAWGESHPRCERLADDSRESIYTGPGE